MNFKSISLLFFCSLFSFNLSGQTKISGTIVDVETKNSLAFVTVFAPNTKEGTTSDFDGAFSFSTTDSVLVISYIGYTAFELEIDQNKKEQIVNIALTPALQVIACPVIRGKLYKTYPSIANLDLKDIQQNNEISIAPILNTVPGVFMHSGALNTNRLTIRGIGNRNLFGTAKIKAFLDGIPLTNGSGESSIEDIDLSILDAVTVYKGPASSIYGAGLGGMINLQVPDNIYKNGNTISFKSTGGSYGLARNTATFTRYNYNKSVFHLNANNTQSKGYRANNRYNRSSFTGFGKFKITEYEEVNLLFSYNFIGARIPSSLDSTDYVDNPERAAFIWQDVRGYESSGKVLAGLSYKASIGKHIRQVSSINASYRNTYEKRPFNILREGITSLGGRSEWIYANNDLGGFISNFEFHIGGEIYNERYNWQTYEIDNRASRDTTLSDNREDRDYSNLFAQVNMDFDYKASLTLGLNRNITIYDFVDFYLKDGDQGSDHKFPSIISPFINAGVNLSDIFLWNNDFSLSATISHGFSPPKLEESLGPDGLINTAIRPEQGWNYELGIRGSIAYQFTYAFSIYSMRIKDLLVARRTNFDQFIGVNAGRTNHNGIEATLDYRFDVKKYNFNLFLNYTYSDYVFKEFIDGDFNHSGNALTGTSPHLLSTGLRWTNGKFYGDLLYRFVDAMPMRDDNSIYSDAYQVVNLKVGYKHAFAEKWTADIFFGTNNLLNEKYASMILINAGSFGGNAPRYYYPGLPRNFYLGMMITFGS